MFEQFAAAATLGLLLAHAAHANRQTHLTSRAAVQVNPAAVDRLDKFWQRALKEVYKSTGELFAQQLREMRHGAYQAALVAGDPRIPEVALTFDDGPHPDYTPKLLAILAKEHVKATFFVIGHQVEAYPWLVASENAQGHLVGNHTFSHVTLTKIPLDEIQTEWRACSDIVQAVIGKRPIFGRPPGGDYDEAVIDAAKQEGITVTLWTDDPGDYASPPFQQLEQKTLRRVTPGAIILLHDGSPETLKLLPPVIKAIKAKGLRFVTVDKLTPSPRDLLLTRLMSAPNP